MKSEPWYSLHWDINFPEIRDMSLPYLAMRGKTKPSLYLN